MATSHPAWTRVQAAIDRAPAGSTVTVFAQDMDRGDRFGRLEDQILVSASTIKIVILAALAQAADDSRLDLQTVVPVLDAQRVGGSGVLTGLKTPGLALTLADHAWLMITVSDNTASNVLIDAVGTDAIRATQQRLGLTGTGLNRRFIGRLPDPGTPENLSTARDLATVLLGIAQGTLASPERCEWMLSVLADQQYRDRLGRYLPQAVTFAGKSGSLEGYCHDTGILSGPNGRAAVAVMTQGIADPLVAVDLIGAIGAAVVADLGLT